jgi:CRP/FNR family transcriptional regulator, cyclic AMP receptor protein
MNREQAVADEAWHETPQSSAGVILPEDLQEIFIRRARAMAVQKGQVVLSEGARGNDVFLIVSGHVQVSRFSRHGREVILAQMGPGEIFGEMAAMASRARTATVTALEISKLAMMGGGDFNLMLAEEPRMELWLARLLVRRVEELNERVFELSTKQVAARVQSELLRLAAATPEASAGRDMVSIAQLPTHADLAARIGSHREAVSRELSTLAKQGLVRQQGRRLDVISISALKALHARLSQ